MLLSKTVTVTETRTGNIEVTNIKNKYVKKCF